MAKAKKTFQEPENNNTPITSFRLNPVSVRKLRYIAIVEPSHKSAAKILDTLADKFIADWEKKNGEIKLK